MYLGPLLCLIMLLMGKKYLMYNLGFWGWHFSFFLQILYWFCNMIIMMCFIFIDKEKVYQSEIASLIIGALLRCAILGAKYGYMSDERHILLNKIRIAQEMLFSDFIIAFNLQYHLMTIKQDLEAVFYRQNIDKNYFYFKTYQKLEYLNDSDHRFTNPEFFSNPEVFDKNKIEFHFNKFKREKLQIRPKQPPTNDQRFAFMITSLLGKNEESLKLSGVSILNEMIYLSRKGKDLKTIVMISSLIRSSCSFLAIFLDGSFEYKKSDWVYWLYQLTFCFASNYASFYTIFFLSLNYTYIIQKKEMLDILTALIDSRNNMFHKYGSYFPLINIYNPLNLFNWLCLRSCIMDQGKKYYQRMQVYTIMTVPMYSFFLAILLTSVFLNLKLSVIDTYALLIMPIDAITILIILFQVFREGANVNSQAMKHKNYLLSLKEEISLLTALNERSKLQSKFDKSDLQKQQCSMKDDFIKKIKEDFNIDVQDEEFEDIQSNISLTENMLNTVIERLDYQYEHQPLTFIGLKLTNELVSSFITIVGTIGVAIVQKLFSQNISKQ